MSNTTQLKIEGMTCAHCVRSVTKALESVSGVQTATVDLIAGTAVVVHDESVPSASLVKAVEDDYKATVA